MRTTCAAISGAAPLCRAALLALLGIGCHSSISADQACTDLATAQCRQLQRCQPIVVSTLYGDFATCQARMKVSCMPALMAPSTSATPAQSDKCAAVLDVSTCASLFTRTPLPECQTQPGKLADGAACGDDAQCVSTYCKKVEQCGVCAQRAHAGDGCAGDADCDFDLACAGNVCAPYRDLGATCDFNNPCAAPNACKNNVCVVPMGPGGTCDRAAQDCDQTKGLYCNVQSVCAPKTPGAAGDECDPSMGCSAGGWCALSGNPERGPCLAAVPDGAPCNPGRNNMPDCQRPALCVGIVGAMDGVCTLPNPATCM